MSLKRVNHAENWHFFIKSVEFYYMEVYITKLNESEARPMEINLESLMAGEAQPPSYKDYQYYRCLKDHVILVNDDITDNLLELATLPLMQMDEDKNVDHIKILLNTYGGQIYAGMSFVSALEAAKTPITVQIMGVAASMGIYIAMAKSDYITTVCQPYSVGLIHAGTYFTDGDRNAAKDNWEFNEKYEEKLRQFILDRTNITEEKYKDIERHEYWIDAQQMLEYGIVDKII